MRIPIVECITYFDKIQGVDFNEAYILIYILIVYLDGNTGFSMILKMKIGCKLLTI